MKLFSLHFQSSKLIHTGGHFGRDADADVDDVAQLRQRRLSQPFAWHNDPSRNGDSGIVPDEDSAVPGVGESEEKDRESNNSSDSKVVPTTCRNSVQGQAFIADDRGIFLKRLLGLSEMRSLVIIFSHSLISANLATILKTA